MVCPGIQLGNCEGARVSGFSIRLLINDSCGPPMCLTYGVRCYDCTDIAVEDCAFEDVSYGIGVIGNSDEVLMPVFRDNIMSNCSMGVGCFDVYGHHRPLFEGNQITDCFYGAEIRNSAPRFDNNEITYCHDGMYYYGHCGGDCIRNLIAHNEECGVYIQSDPPSAAPSFNGGAWPDEANDIFDNGTWDIWYAHSGPDALVMALFNYWGADCPDFSSKIYGRAKYGAWVDSTHTVILTEDDCPDATEPSTWGAIKAMYR